MPVYNSLDVLVFSACLFDFTIGYENLAFNKTAWQTKNHYPDRWLASAAVDGDRTQKASSDACAVIETSSKGTWTLDLGQIQSIHHIDIYYRNESSILWVSQYRWRFAGFFLYISNTTNKDNGFLCFHELQNITNPPLDIISIPCIQHGRYIIYYNERIVTQPDYYSPFVWNELCEVEVYGCNNTNVFGKSCNYTCPEDCTNQFCDIMTGHCLPCSHGYQGELCDKSCDNNFYGTDCRFQCNNCINETSCNHVNGTCFYGCALGWTGDTCNTPNITDPDKHCIFSTEVSSSNTLLIVAVSGWILFVLSNISWIGFYLKSIRRNSDKKEKQNPYHDINMDTENVIHTYNTIETPRRNVHYTEDRKEYDEINVNTDNDNPMFDLTETSTDEVNVNSGTDNPMFVLTETST